MEQKKILFSIRIETYLLDDLERLAEDYDSNKSECIRKLIEKAKEQKQVIEIDNTTKP